MDQLHLSKTCSVLLVLAQYNGRIADSLKRADSFLHEDPRGLIRKMRFSENHSHHEKTTHRNARHLAAGLAVRPSLTASFSSSFDDHLN
jgi:hypothetical protein